MKINNWYESKWRRLYCWIVKSAYYNQRLPKEVSDIIRAHLNKQQERKLKQFAKIKNINIGKQMGTGMIYPTDPDYKHWIDIYTNHSFHKGKI